MWRYVHFAVYLLPVVFNATAFLILGSQADADTAAEDEGRPVSGSAMKINKMFFNVNCIGSEQLGHVSYHLL